MAHVFRRPRHLHLFLLLVLSADSFSSGPPLRAQDDAPKEPTKDAPAQDPKADANAASTDDASSDEAPAKDNAEAADDVAPVTAIVGASVHTLADRGVIEDATIVLRGDKIEAVGSDVEVPAGARVIDAKGMTITPGLVDLRGTLGMTGAAISDRGTTAALDAVDGVDPFNHGWREVARQGITAVYVQPAANGSLGGYGALLRVAPGNGSLDSIVLRSEAGFQSSLGVATFGGSAKSRLGEFEGLKKRLKDAKDYREAWDKYRKYEAEQKDSKDGKVDDKGKPAANEEKRAGGEAGNGDPRRGRRGPPGRGGEGPRPGSQAADKEGEQKPDAKEGQDGDKKSADAKADDKKEEAPKKPKLDPLKERLVEVLAGKVPLHLEVHRADDVRRALELAKEFPEIAFLWEGLSNTGSATSDLLKTGLPMVLGPWSDDQRASHQDTERVELWAEQYHDYAGRLAIATFAQAGRGSKMLRFAAARALAAGMPRETVLAAITRVPAELAAAGKKIGQIEPGYQADLAVFAGDPLDPATPVRITISAGEVTFENDSLSPANPAVLPTDDSELPRSLPSTFAIRTTQLLQPDGSFAAGSVVVTDGKITSIAAADADLGDVQLFDLGDVVVTPGLVTAHAMLIPGALEDRQNVVDSGALQAADAFDPDAPAVRRLIRGGFLRAGHAPGDARVIAGPLAEVRLGADDPIVTRQIAEKIIFSGDARSRDRFPASLAGQQQLLRESLESAGEPLPLYLPAAALAVLDEAREARRQALAEGQRPMLIRAETDAEVIAVIKLTKELGIRATLLGPDELQNTAEFLPTANIGVVTRPLRSVDFDWFVGDLAAATAAGTPLGFAGADPLDIRRTAAALVQAGVAPETVLRGLTRGGAELVGMSDGAGQLSVGQPADMVLWSGSPLHLAAQPLAVIVDGKFLRMED